jgi:threonylcarbamoyladenosine tRNA methylthiotransferase MtaB
VLRFYVENFGCRATQSDGAAIEWQFEQNGLDRTDSDASADLVVLNTCAVTAAAEQDARAAIRRIKRGNPQCKIVITGCYAQRAPEEVARLEGVWRVIGNSHKSNLAHITLQGVSLNDIAASAAFVPVEKLDVRQLDSAPVEIFVSDIFAHTELQAAPVFDSANERTRPNLKVQDGCNNRCSFCIIPSVRGRSRSMRLDDAVESVNRLVQEGYKEVVISGINLGRWGRDLSSQPGEPDRLETLVRAILDGTNLEKLRISSVEPMDWSDALIRLMAESPRIAKHAHVPMQSGSDAVLRRMHRKYRPWHYREKIERIRSEMPTAAIGADVMVGFPGESDGEFEETRRMIESLPFTYLHVFTFSARPGTPAASMPNHVALPVARKRNGILRDLASRKKLEFMRSFVNREVEAITLNVSGEDAEGIWTEALTENYLQLRLRGRHDANRWMRANVRSVANGRLMA